MSVMKKSLPKKVRKFDCALRVGAEKIVYPYELANLGKSDRVLVDASALCAAIHESARSDSREQPKLIRELALHLFARGCSSASICYGDFVKLQVSEVCVVFGSIDAVPTGVVRKLSTKKASAQARMRGVK